jgi:hypothetical protein
MMPMRYHCCTGRFPPYVRPHRQSRQAIIFRLAALFLKGCHMLTDAHNGIDHSLQPEPAWADVWHLWRVIFPRRSITGRLVCGNVWRRRDGRRWIYKKFVEY